MSDLGDQVRAARKERGLSQRELAKRAGVAFTTVQRLENEDRKITESSLYAILSALNEASPLNPALLDELKKAALLPLMEKLVPGYKNKKKEEKLRWATELPILHKKIDLFKTYASFRVTYDLVDRIRSLEEAVYPTKIDGDISIAEVLLQGTERQDPITAPIDEGDSAHGEA